MKIIAHANNVYIGDEFDQLVLNNPSLSGVSFDITTTKDGTIILFNPTPNNVVSLGSIQNTSSANLKEFNISTLDIALNSLSDYKGKIIINVLPLYYPPINENTVAMINQQNKEYVEAISKVVAKYPYIDLYFCSTNENIVNNMKQILNKFKIGIVLQTGNLNYIDVDFYKISVELMDLRIIQQQLQLKKEVVVFIADCDDTTLILRYFYQHPSSASIKDFVFNNIIFECNYPEIFYLTFR